MKSLPFPPVAIALLFANLAIMPALGQEGTPPDQGDPSANVAVDTEVEPEVARVRALEPESKNSALTTVERFDAALTLLRHRRFSEAHTALEVVIDSATSEEGELRAAASAIRDSVADTSLLVPISEIVARLATTHGAEVARRAEAALWMLFGMRSDGAIQPQACREGIAALERLAAECSDPRLAIEAEILRAMTAIREPDFASAQSAVERAKTLIDEVSDPCCSMQVAELEGRLCFLMERYDEAVEPLTKGRDLAKRFDLLSDQQTLESFLGQSLLFLNRIEDALTHLERGLELARRLAMPQRMFSALESIGMTHCATGNFEAGNAAFAECTAIAEQLGDLRLRTVALRNVAFGHYAANDLDATIAALEAMRTTADLAGDRDSLLEAEVRLAETAGIQGNFAAMESHAQRALSLQDAPRFPTFSITAWSMLARAHTGLGEYDSALRESEAAIDESRRRGVRVTCADGLLLRANILLELGDYAASLKNAQEALEMLRPSDPNATLARAHLHIAAAKLALRQFDEAANEARMARELAAEDEFTILHSGWIEARIAILSRDFARALEIADAIHERATQFGNLDYVRRSALLAAGAALGASEASDEEPTKQWSRIEAAIAEAVGSENRLIRMAGRELATLLAIRRGQLESARNTVEAALAEIEDVAGSEVGATLGIERASHLRSNFSDFGKLAQDLTTQEVEAANGDTVAIAEITSRGYEHVARFKSRALLEGILEHRARGRTKETQQLVALRRERTDQKERALIAAANHLRAMEPDQAARERDLAESCSKEIARIDAELANVGARDVARVRDLAPDLNALRAAGHASEDSIVLDFVTSSSTLSVYRIDGTTLELRSLGSSTEIDQDIERYRDLISNKSSLGSVTDIAHLGHQLYIKLLEPCLNANGADSSGLPRRIVIIPDGVMSTLPFEALVVSTPDAPTDFSAVEFALDRFDIRYAPSASVLVELSRAVPYEGTPSAREPATGSSGKRDPRPALIFAEPSIGESFPAIPSAKVEGDLVVRQFTDSRLLSGEHAVSSALDQDLRAFSVLHFAVHGIVNSMSPLGTGLWLRGPQGQPDLLSVSEVMDLDLDADLVVLSACSSSRGSSRDGEGIESLARAFLFAGARSVVASQWELQDTAALHVMSSFYENFGHHQTSACQALLDAKRQLRRKQAVTAYDPQRGVGSVRTTVPSTLATIAGHPYLWAPLIYIGADASRHR